MSDGVLDRRTFLALAGAGPLAAAGTAGPAGARPVDSGLRIMSERSTAFESRYLSVSGLETHMLLPAHPPARGAPPVVLVHGLALSGQYMVPVGEALAPNYPVFAPDLPGFGDTGKPDRVLDVEGLADALARWVEAVELEPAIYLGNSFGCQIIVEFASRYPQHVLGTVLQGPTTPPEERSWFWQLVRWRQNAPNNPPLMGEVADIDYGKCGFVRALQTFEFSLRDRVEDKLAGVDRPSLIVRGEEDPICNQQWAEQVAGGLPNGTLEVIPEVAHTLVFTHPVELGEATHRFAQQIAELT